jgi:hypothetical protein
MLYNGWSPWGDDIAWTWGSIQLQRHHPMPMVFRTSAVGLYPTLHTIREFFLFCFIIFDVLNMYVTVYRTLQLICWGSITLLASRRLKRSLHLFCFIIFDFLNMYFTVYRTLQLICWESITLLASGRLKTVNTHQSAANWSTTIWWNPATCTSQRFSCNLSFIPCSEVSNDMLSI